MGDGGDICDGDDMGHWRSMDVILKNMIKKPHFIPGMQVSLAEQYLSEFMQRRRA